MKNYISLRNVTCVNLEDAFKNQSLLYGIRQKKADIMSYIRNAKIDFMKRKEENKEVEKETGVSFEIALKGRFEDSEKWQFDLWEVKGHGDFLLEFRQGVGHSYSFTYHDGRQWQTVAICKEPSILDILYCIRMDDTQGQTFEQWCDDYGYDPDSRKAEKIYKACRDQTDMFRRNYSFNVWEYERLEDY